MAFRGAAALVLAVSVAGCTDPGTIPPPPFLEPVHLEISADRSEATLGDVVQVDLSVSWQEGVEIDFVEPELTGPLVLVDTTRSEERLESARWTRVHSYRLKADGIGVFVFPPVRVSYRDGGDSQTAAPSASGRFVESDPLEIEVISLLAAEADASDIRDIKPIREVRERRSVWPWVIAVAVLAGGAAFAVAWWRRRRGAEAVPLPPHVLALEALRRLEPPERGSLQALRRYYFDLSRVLREYVEGRFSLNATDLTTEEIGTRLGRLDLAPEEDSALRRFLEHSDLVKFAGHEPTGREVRDSWEGAVRFVEKTKPVELEEAPA